MVGTTDSPWDVSLYLAAACVPGRSPTGGSTAHATAERAGPPGSGRARCDVRSPAVRGPSVPAAADPRHDIVLEPSRPWGPGPEPTSLGTEWRCGNPSAGTAGQGTRVPQEGAR